MNNTGTSQITSSFRCRCVADSFVITASFTAYQQGKQEGQFKKTLQTAARPGREKSQKYRRSFASLAATTDFTSWQAKTTRVFRGISIALAASLAAADPVFYDSSPARDCDSVVCFILRTPVGGTLLAPAIRTPPAVREGSASSAEISDRALIRLHAYLVCWRGQNFSNTSVLMREHSSVTLAMNLSICP